MSWISRASLRRDGAATRALVKLLLENAGGDAGHRLVWSLFSGDPAGRRTFLYRQIEEGRYLVLSRDPPADESGLWSLETKPFDADFAAGRRFGFLLRANPSLRVRSERDGSGRGKRADAVMHAKRKARAEGSVFDEAAEQAAALAWLFARAERLGVRFEDSLCQATSYEPRRIERRDSAPALFHSIDFDGVFEVEDSERLGQAILAGVGSAKAYGCGLMLIRPAGEPRPRSDVGGQDRPAP